MSTTLEQQDIKALEQLRQRLSQLTNSISTLQRDLQTTELLPPWPHLTSLLSIIAQNLSAVSTTQAQHSALLSSLAVYPLPEYPGRTQEGLLEQLLRKKLEPGVEDWVEKGRSAGLSVTAPSDANKPESAGLDGPALRELWDWAGGAANERAREHAWGGDYTKEEVEGGVEGVKTGLRRKLRVPGEESSEEESSDEDMEEDGQERVGVRRMSTGHGVELDISGPGKRDEGKMMPLADQWRFMMTGTLPKGVAG